MNRFAQALIFISFALTACANPVSPQQYQDTLNQQCGTTLTRANVMQQLACREAVRTQLYGYPSDIQQLSNSKQRLAAEQYAKGKISKAQLVAQCDQIAVEANNATMQRYQQQQLAENERERAVAERIARAKPNRSRLHHRKRPTLTASCSAIP